MHARIGPAMLGEVAVRGERLPAGSALSPALVVVEIPLSDQAHPLIPGKDLSLPKSSALAHCLNERPSVVNVLSGSIRRPPRGGGGGSGHRAPAPLAATTRSTSSPDISCRDFNRL